MTTMTRSSLSESLTVVEVKPGLKFSLGTLRQMLPDVESVMFFAKLYDLSAQQLGNLLHQVMNSAVTAALFTEDHHSYDLQDYLLDIEGDMLQLYGVDLGDVVLDPRPPKGEILPEVWKNMEIEVAASIKAVAEKLASVVERMPGKQGHMAFASMRVMNAKRPTIGDFKAKIDRAPQKQNLVILDVSGSMSESTVTTIVDDVVALAYMANAHFAIVSNTCTVWEPGTYNSSAVLAKAEFGGTHYEELAPLFDGADWGTVVTIADYDSSPSAIPVVGAMPGHIDEVIDISLVNQPTFMAQVVGQLADDVRPLLIGKDYRVLS